MRDWIGGSDIAAVMGMSKWKSPLQLWAEKTGRIEPADLSDNEAVELGVELEDFVAKKFEKKTGLKVRRTSNRYIHKDHDYMRCQVDRLIENSDMLLEVKTCSAWMAKEWEGEDIPQDYILQVMWQLGITGRETGYIAVLIGGQRFKYKQIPFDKELFDKMVEAAELFWNYVKNDEPPTAMGMDNYFIQEIHPDSSETMESVQNMEEAVALLQETKMHIKELEEQKGDLEAKLKQVIGDNLGISTDKYVVTWKTQTGARVDVQALKDAKIYDQYTKPTKTRVLRVKLNKEKENGHSK